MNGIFIAGTDTGVGKTVVTGLLAVCLRQQGINVITQKWVQTGSKPLDIDVHARISGMKVSAATRKLMMPYWFKYPASPHLAARRAKRKISVKAICGAYRKLAREHDLVLVEGTGGLMVPLSEKTLMIDVVKKLKLPVILVSANRLGTINQTLLSVAILRQQRIPLLGIVYNTIVAQSKAITDDNPKIIRRLSGARTLAMVPFMGNNENLD